MSKKADVLLIDRILNSGLLDKAEASLLEKLASGGEVVFEKLGNIYRQQGMLSHVADLYDRWAEKFPQSQKAKYLADLFNRRPQSAHWPKTGFVPTPFQIREDFLPAAFHDEFVRFVVDSRNRFMPSKLATELNGEWKNIHYPELHNSIQINLPSELKKRFLAEIAEFLPSIGKQAFSQSCATVSPFLLRHGDGNFFAAHTDIYNSGTPGITLVYYFSGPEANFSGGGNVFFDTDLSENSCNSSSFTLLPFSDNRLIAFPGNHYHGVLPVRSNDDRFECGRFSLVTFLTS